MEGFRSPRIAALAGTNIKTLHYWDKSGFLSPSVAKSHGAGSRRLYSFADLVAVRVTLRLREAGISLQSLRKVVKRLQQHQGLSHPLAECYLLTDGKEVFLPNGERLVAILRQPGQRLFHVLNLGETVGELQRAVIRLNKARSTEKTKRGRTCAG
jgi:DNA-binding transcriptional MerR regulator